MKHYAFSHHLKQSLLLLGLAIATPIASAAAWSGTANYTAAPGATGDEAVVGPFDTYDFGLGVGLVKVNNDGTLSGYFQTYVNDHILTNAGGINVPQLNVSGASGSGNGFELTVVANFTGTYSVLPGGVQSFSLTGGNVGLYFDTTPDFSFGADSGFNDGTAILSGTLTGGSGFISLSSGKGIEQLDLSFSGIFGSSNSSVYSAPIGGGSALFSIDLKNSTLLPGITSVQGHNKSEGSLAAVDGSINLTAVPLPAAAWMFGAGLVGLLGAGQRKKTVA
ncbi:flocculation-associated PEP-CTERM protein PepA [Methylomonas sp. HW2-6]|uniref:flocculation-associated PEP-CTERM protein PepA n=1 Tax=Methylomonas sp. HW2-6 TaxID=3376687 RepID=UPI00404342CD